VKKLVIPALCLLAVALAGCTGNRESDGQKAEHKVQQQIEDNYAQAQPVPALTNSQVRQNLIEIKEAIAEGVETTSFFFNLGSQDPVKTCPSIGAPIPSAAQLTNPEQIVNPPGDISAMQLPQMDPDGIYTGDSSGTYVLCIEAKGAPYVSYWEGSVLSEFAPAKWNYDQHTVELLGSSSWDFSKHTPTSVVR